MVSESGFVFDDFDGHALVLFEVEGLNHLAKRAFAEQDFDLVSIRNCFTGLDDVIVVFIVKAVVVCGSLFLLLRFFGGVINLQKGDQQSEV